MYPNMGEPSWVNGSARRPLDTKGTDQITHSDGTGEPVPPSPCCTGSRTLCVGQELTQMFFHVGMPIVLSMK